MTPNGMTIPLESLNINDSQHFYYHENARVSVDMQFYLSGPILPASFYQEMIARLDNAQEGDTAKIILNTSGGDLAAGVQIISAMRESKATVITRIDGECFSLGTMIFLSGDECEVSPYAIAMFHNYSGGVEGKGNEQLAELTATKEWFESLAKNIWVPFLSEEELTRILRGEDLWMMTDEIIQRLINISETELDDIDMEAMEQASYDYLPDLPDEDEFYDVPRQEMPNYVDVDSLPEDENQDFDTDDIVKKRYANKFPITTPGIYIFVDKNKVSRAFHAFGHPDGSISKIMQVSTSDVGASSVYTEVTHEFLSNLKDGDWIGPVIA